jgi:hypothetical protein
MSITRKFSVTTGRHPVACKYQHVMPWWFPRLYWTLADGVGWHVMRIECCTRHFVRANREIDAARRG